MLTLLYTSDQLGMVVVPYVDQTRQYVEAILKEAVFGEPADGDEATITDLPGVKVFVRPWMKALLPDLPGLTVIDEATNWAAVAADDLQHMAFYEDELADWADSFIEILLTDDDVVESGVRGPMIDLTTMGLEQHPLQDGCRINHWTPLEEALGATWTEVEVVF